MTDPTRNHLELRQLRYFVAVAEELSFRRAAERLFITQPPLSRQIAELEQDIGAPLFERDRRGVRLTALGTELLDEARRLLAAAGSLYARARNRAQASRPLRIGLTTVVDPGLFAWLEPALQAQHPNLRPLFKRQISRRSVRDVLAGTLDAALIGLPSHTGTLAVEVLCDEPLLIALPASHALARRQRISLRELAQDRLFWFSRPLNPAYFDHFEALFQRLDFNPQRLEEPGDHHVLLGLIAEGAGFGLVSASLRAISRKGVVYRQPKEAAELRMRIAVARRAEEPSPDLSALLRTLRAHASA